MNVRRKRRHVLIPMLREMDTIKGILFDLGGTLIKEGGCELLGDVVFTLNQLKSNYKLGVVSNTDTKTEEDVRRILRKLGIEDYFDTVVVSKDIGYRKPDVRIFSIALERLRLKPEEALMVGNRTDVDIKGGKALGMMTVLIDWNNEPRKEPLPAEENPTYTINSIDELLKILQAGRRL
ncbi:MAG: HAD family hydrolase [Candidatus Bathyarchaeia archaeon]